MNRTRRSSQIVALAGLALAIAFSREATADVLMVRDAEDQKVRLEGNVLASFHDGSMVFETPDTKFHAISKSKILDHERQKAKVARYTRPQFRAALAREFPGFQLHETNRYLICYQSPKAFAFKAGQLFESAYSHFADYFANVGGFRLEHPKYPLVAVIFADRERYVAHMTKVIGERAPRTAGAYSQLDNRMYMYGFPLVGKPTEAGFLRGFGEQAPVVVHEAIHQVAFNSGFHKRQNNNPAWLVEGMAMFFETSSDQAGANWHGGGGVNGSRVRELKRSFDARSANTTLAILLRDDLFSGSAAPIAYAEAWAMTHYLATKRNTEYMKYIRLVNGRPPYRRYEPEDRIRDIKIAFGQSPEELEKSYMAQMTPIVNRSSKKTKK